MSRVTVILNSKARREQAARWCLNAPINTRVEFKETKRTVPQNDRMHAMLTELAVQARYHGLKMHKDDWKLLFLDALWRQRGEDMRLVPNLDGTGLVPLHGRSSSDLSVAEMTDMIELLFAYGAANGVEFSEGDQGTGGAKNLAREVA
ncbi:recombination protein NinB [Phenylobacterium sp.]|uniref:recombination protein NinB n=1 Tax=Phenylobacterium sp. TaxID=1871053 RepID=UPI002610505A|nr:recombination protein NinB [Phenylobacterium sp.]